MQNKSLEILVPEEILSSLEDKTEKRQWDQWGKVQKKFKILEQNSSFGKQV